MGARGALLLAAWFVFEGTTQASPLACRRTIAKEAARYAQTRLKALQRCDERVLRSASEGACPDARAAQGIAVAGHKLAAKIATACGGANQRCDASDTGADADDSPASIGWPGTCPGFALGACANTIADCSDIASCLACIAGTGVDQALTLAYGRLAPSPEGSTLNSCQAALGHAAAQFYLTRSKALAQCEDRMLRALVPGPCPDPKAALKIAPADAKRNAESYGACAGMDRVCGGGDDFAPAEIGFVALCPAVTVPGGRACGGVAGGLQEVVDCLDCTTEFVGDCLAAVAAPNLGPYPSVCRVATTPLPAPPPRPPGCGNGLLEAGEDCDPPGSPVCPNASNGLETCSAACQCPCPGRLELTTTDGTLKAIDAGSTGLGHDLPGAARGTKLTVQLTGCEQTHAPCGECAIAGLVANTAAGAGDVDNQRCSGDTRVSCHSDCDCAAVGGSCEFYIGGYIPGALGGVPFCMLDRVEGPVTGTTDLTSGASTLQLKAAAGFFISTCPTCDGDPTSYDGVRAGTCSGGRHAGLPCDANGSSNGSTNPFLGNASLDCPPAGTPITLPPSPLTLTTGTQTRSLSAASPSCRASGFTGMKCFCDTCDNQAATPCSSNADCAAVGAAICGGKRCLGNAVNRGAPCQNNSQCPNGACGVPGSPSAPNACADGICTPTVGDDGECMAGPVDIYCGPTATFHGCLNDAECSQYLSCTGGTRDGAVCAGPSDCPGGSCDANTCSVVRVRPCFTDNGVTAPRCFGGAQDGVGCSLPADCPDGFCGGSRVTASGTASVPAADEWDVTLAGLTCAQPASLDLASSLSGFPGLLRATFVGHVRALP
jgi:hypothetical protein